MATAVTDKLSTRLPESLVWLVGYGLLLCSLIAASLYTSALVNWVTRRRWRVLAFLPVLVFLTVLPNALFSRDTHILGVGAAACVASWWAAHKSLSYLLNYRDIPTPGSKNECYVATDGSPLSRTRALLTFCAVIILPVRLARTKERRQSTVRPMARAVWYIMILAFVGARLLPYVAASGWYLQALYRGLIVFGTSAFVADICAAIAESFGVYTERAFNAPWMAASLNEFWTKRWNLPASDVLRDSVYYPIIDLLTTINNSYIMGVYDESKPDKAHKILHRISSSADRRKALFNAPASWRVLASILTFFVSGVMHELVIFCLTGAITGEMTLFFTLHGLMVVCEGAAAIALQHACGKKQLWTAVPIFLRRLATVSLVLLTGHWLFMEPMVRGNIDIKAGANMMALYDSLISAPKSLQHLKGLNILGTSS